MTEKSKSTQPSPSVRLLHRVDDPRLVRLELRLDFLLAGARPLQERRLVLVDRHADRRRLLGAVLAVAVLLQDRELPTLSAYRDLRQAVDAHRVDVLRKQS